MFHQTYFYPSGKHHHQQSQNGSDFAGLSAASAASVDSFAELRKQYFRETQTQQFGQGFGFGSSAVARNRTSIGDSRNAVFAPPTTTTTTTHDPSANANAIAIAPSRFGSYLLNVNSNLAIAAAASSASASPLFASAEPCTINATDHEPRKPQQRDRESNRESPGSTSTKPRVVGSDADTATTASVATSVSSPSPIPSLRSNSPRSQNDRDKAEAETEAKTETETIRFVLENTKALPEWISNSSNSKAESFDREEEEETPAPSPNPRSNSPRSQNDRDETEAETETIRFVFENTEVLPEWISNSKAENCSPEEKEEETPKVDFTERAEVCIEDCDEELEYEREVSDDADSDEEDSCSCFTPIFKNTSQPQQTCEHQNQQQQQQAFRSREKASVMTTTTTETKTTTTTTTERTIASSVNASKSVSSTTAPRSNSISKPSGGHRSDVPAPFVGILKSRGSHNAAVDAHNHQLKPNSAIAIATTSASASALTKPSKGCKSCASKQRQIELQRDELRQLKLTVKRLCLLLADTVGSGNDDIGSGSSNGNNNSNGNCDDSYLLASDPHVSNASAKATANRPSHEFVPATPVSCGISRDDGSTSTSTSTSDKHKHEDDLGSVATSAIIPSSSALPLPSLKIDSVPVRSVGRDCPRIRNRRILVNGQWGTYSGPTPGVKPNEDGQIGSENETQGESKIVDESKNNDAPSSEAGILQGCVVRLDEGELYIGNLSCNDTGSFTFHAPGTLYDSNRKPLWRIR